MWHAWERSEMHTKFARKPEGTRSLLGDTDGTKIFRLVLRKQGIKAQDSVQSWARVTTAVTL
jgi:hypothetical protein